MKGKLGTLKKRIGFLPLWGWLTLGGVLVYVWRKRTSSASTTPATDIGAAAATGTGGVLDTSGGFGAGAGDGGGLPLDTPAPQGTPDPMFGQPGAAAVYDPLGSSPNATGTGDGAPLTGLQSDVSPEAPATTYTPPVPGVDYPVVGPHASPTVSGSGSKKARPKSTHGTKSSSPRARKAPELISEHGKGQMVAHPVSKASKPRARKAPELISEHGKGQAAAVTRSRTTGAGAAATKPAPHPKPTPPRTQVHRPGVQR